MFFVFDFEFGDEEGVVFFWSGGFYVFFCYFFVFGLEGGC